MERGGRDRNTQQDQNQRIDLKHRHAGEKERSTPQQAEQDEHRPVAKGHVGRNGNGGGRHAKFLFEPLPTPGHRCPPPEKHGPAYQPLCRSVSVLSVMLVR
jgi:hypothetical protein